MVDLVLRTVKGSALTNEEVDQNFENLAEEFFNTAKYSKEFTPNDLTEVGEVLNSGGRFYLVTIAGITGINPPTHLAGSAISGSCTLQFYTPTEYTPNDVLKKIKTLDGIGSGLDADFLRGLSASSTVPTSVSKISIVTRDASGNFSANTITGNLNGTVTGGLIGGVTGNVTGNVTGTATNATLLTNLSPSSTLPAPTNKSSIVSRNSLGNSTFNVVFSTELDISGDVKFGNAGTDTTEIIGQLRVNSSSGTSGQILSSRGPNQSPQWVSSPTTVLIESENTNANRFITFVDGSGNQNLTIDGTTTPLTYNPSTNTIASNISGNATTSTTSTNVSGGTANVSSLTLTSTSSSNANIAQILTVNPTDNVVRKSSIEQLVNSLNIGGVSGYIMFNGSTGLVVRSSNLTLTKLETGQYRINLLNPSSTYVPIISSVDRLSIRGAGSTNPNVRIVQAALASFSSEEFNIRVTITDSFQQQTNANDVDTATYFTQQYYDTSTLICAVIVG